MQHQSLPHDNVLSQGGGPLAVEGVLLNSVVIYHALLHPTPSVTYGASSLQHHGVVREPFGSVFTILVKQISTFQHCTNPRGQR